MAFIQDQSSRSGPRVLLVRLAKERAFFDAPLFLELEQLARPVPFGAGFAHEIAPRTVEVLELDADGPGLLVLGLERHFVTRPLRISARKRRLDEGVVVDERNAVTLLK